MWLQEEGEVVGSLYMHGSRRLCDLAHHIRKLCTEISFADLVLGLLWDRDKANPQLLICFIISKI